MAKKDELSSLNNDIQAQTERLKKLKEKKKRLLEADNIKLGKMVRKVFGSFLPDSDVEREMFFNMLKQRFESSDFDKSIPNSEQAAASVNPNSELRNSSVISPTQEQRVNMVGRSES